MSTITNHSRQPTSEELAVLKLGGSTLADPRRVASVLDVIADARTRGAVAVVVSALGDTTDALLSAADAAAGGDASAADAIVDRLVATSANSLVEAVGGAASVAESLRATVTRSFAPLRSILAAIAVLRDCSPAARDGVLAFGELTSAALFREALRSHGIDAEAIDARTWVVTDDRHGNADVRWDATLARVAQRERAWRGRGVVTVHTGFLGATEDGRATTLGRNGSDYTAALLARALGATGVTIWTDVSGVLTADPTIVDDAYPVPALSYREALELAGLGLRMFHPRTMIPLLTAGIPMRIRNSARPEDPGTLVDATGSPDESRATCVVSLEDMALVALEGSHRTTDARVATRALAALGRAGITASFAAHAHHGNGIAIVVKRADAERAAEAIGEELARELARGDLARPTIDAPVSLLTLVAEAMGKTPNVAGRFFGAIGAIGVNVRAASQGATSRAISCVIEDRDTVAAVRAVHAAFNLAREQVNVLLLGKGTVGKNFLDQVTAEGPALRERHEIDVRLFGVVDRRASLSAATGIDPRTARTRLAESSAPADVIALLDELRRLPVPVLIDCTAADGMERIYEEAFARGVHVVTANKKPFALPTTRRDALFAAARRAHRGLRYETTVGASLPVIDTLQNLVRTGDHVRLVEGSFSGTLGFLANAVSAGERLSVAVQQAHARGYTEPNPADDLGGVDAARKALILARELGFVVDLEDVEVQPFVPKELLAAPDREALFRALERHDATFAAGIASLRSEGRVLRYLARIEPPLEPGRRARVRVAPTGVGADHPAARLRGTEALVAFHTERYAEYPLVVQGAGAGGSVTAAGILADVLSLSQSLRGR
jgi:aspartokinase/homoserine dehydrogenase 1